MKKIEKDLSRHLFFAPLILFRSLDMYGMAEFLSLYVPQVYSWTAGLNLAFGLTLDISLNNPLWFGLLKVSNANFLVRASLHSTSVGSSRLVRATSYGRASPLTL